MASPPAESPQTIQDLTDERRVPSSAALLEHKAVAEKANDRTADDPDDDEEEEEEEEEEDEEEAERIRRGFIVEEAEQDEEDEDEEDDDEEEVEAGLDEDDLDLIAENMGLPVAPRQPSSRASASAGSGGTAPSSGFRRLKKAAQLDDEEEEADALFGRDESDDERGDEDDRRRDRLRRGWEEEEEEGVATYGMQPEAAALIADIFGDIGTVMEILGRRKPREEDMMEDVVEAGERPTPTLPPTVAKKWAAGARELAEGEFLTDSDDVIRYADMPERLCTLLGPTPRVVPPEEIAAEAAWVTWKLMPDWGLEAALPPQALVQRYKAAFGDRSSYYDPATTPVSADVEEKVTLVLTWILNQHVEIPFIIAHRAHLVCPPLTERSLWVVEDLHREWARLHQASQHVLGLLDKLDDPNLAQYRPPVADFRADQDIDDVRAFILFMDADVIGEAAARRRQALAADVSRPVRKFQLDEQWRPHLLDSHQFAANVSKSEGLSCLVTGQQPSASADLACVVAPPPGPPLPGRGAEGVAAWLASLRVGPFSTGPRVLEALLSYEAKQLAVNPTVRRSLREWFWRHATLSVYPKSETFSSPGRRNWAALTLFRKPAADLTHVPFVELPPAKPSGPSAHEQRRLQLIARERQCREAIAFLDILKAEANDLAAVIVHPLDMHEAAPWRQSNGDTADPAVAADAVAGPPKKKLRLATMDDIIEKFSAADQQDNHDIQKLLSVLAKLYCSAATGSSWAAEVQTQVLHRLVTKELLPLFRRELRRTFQRRAEAFVAALCSDDLLWRLDVKPYRRPKGKPFHDREDDSDHDSGDESMDSASSSSSSSSSSETDDDEAVPFWTPRAVGIVVERLSPGIRVHLVATNRNGIPIHALKLDRLLPDDRMRRSQALLARDQKLAQVDRDALKAFLLRSDLLPEIVVIGAGDVLARALFDIITDIRNALRGRARRRRRFEVVYGSLEVPRIFAASDLCPKEFIDSYGISGAQAIGLCRATQDPLAAHLELWSEAPNTPNLLLHLEYHPLQSMLPRERLEFALRQAAQMAVASVGVDVNAIKAWPHLQAPLQFVPGLGPRKAPLLLSIISGPLVSRAQLQQPEASTVSPPTTWESVVKATSASAAATAAATGDEEDDETGPNAPVGAAGHQHHPVGPTVFLNCASFIRISQELALDVDCPDPLACTRVHPTESYASAYKMARDALEDTKSTPTECIAAVLANSSCLEELDLEEYSVILNTKGQPRVLPHLEMVRKELDEPYKDPRFPFESLSGSRLFYHLTQEDPYDFQPGCETSATVLENRGGAVRLALQPSGVPAVPEDLSDFLRQEAVAARKGGGGSWDRPPVTLETLLPLGAVIPCRLKFIDPTTFSTTVILSYEAAAILILETLRQEFPGLTPPHLSVSSIRHLLEPLPPTSPSPSSSIPRSATGPHGEPEDTTAAATRQLRRRIPHPRFRATTSSSAILSELRRARVGEALFGQSAKSSDQLLLYIKVCHSPFLAKMMLLRELDKRTPAELGHKLQIGNQQFMDLDQILGQYVEALRVNLSEVYAFEKYRTGDSVEAVEKALLTAQEAKLATSGECSIEWGITVDAAYPSHQPGVRFHLIAIPPQKPGGTELKPIVLKDGIYVSPEGFKLWNHKERSLRRLTNWWKKEGYFQRKVLLAEYNAAKKLQRSKQAPPPVTTATPAWHDDSMPQHFGDHPAMSDIPPYYDETRFGRNHGHTDHHAWRPGGAADPWT